MAMSDTNKLSAAEKATELGLQSSSTSSTLAPTIDEKLQKKLVHKIDLLVLPALGMHPQLILDTPASRLSRDTFIAPSH